MEYNDNYRDEYLNRPRRISKKNTYRPDKTTCCSCFHRITGLSYLSGLWIMYFLHLVFALRTFSMCEGDGRNHLLAPFLHILLTHIYTKAIYTGASLGILAHSTSIITLCMRVLYFPN